MKAKEKPKTKFDIFSGSLHFIMCNNACFMLKYLLKWNKILFGQFAHAHPRTPRNTMEMKILKFTDLIFILRGEEFRRYLTPFGNEVRRMKMLPYSILFRCLVVRLIHVIYCRFRAVDILFEM